MSLQIDMQNVVSTKSDKITSSDKREKKNKKKNKQSFSPKSEIQGFVISATKLQKGFFFLPPWTGSADLLLESSAPRALLSF